MDSRRPSSFGFRWKCFAALSAQSSLICDCCRKENATEKRSQIYFKLWRGKIGGGGIRIKWKRNGQLRKTFGKSHGQRNWPVEWNMSECRVTVHSSPPVAMTTHSWRFGTNRKVSAMVDCKTLGIERALWLITAKVLRLSDDIELVRQLRWISPGPFPFASSLHCTWIASLLPFRLQ